MRSASLYDVERALLMFPKGTTLRRLAFAAKHDEPTTQASLIRLQQLNKVKQVNRRCWRPTTDVERLHDATVRANTTHPLQRCLHGNALKDHSDELLEPSCGCRIVQVVDETNPPNRAPLSVKSKEDE